MGTGWVAGAAGVGGEVAAAWPEAEPGPGGGGGSAGGSGAAGHEAEPGSGVSAGAGAVAGAGGGLVPGGERGSPLGWSLVLYKKPSGQSGSGQRESCWAGHADEPASPAPVDSGWTATSSVSMCLL